MKLNHHKYKKNYETYILNSIDSEGYDITTNSDKDKINFFIDTFYKEKGYEIKRKGLYSTLSEYLSGLPSSISLPYYNEDIINLAIQMGSVDSELNNAQKDKIISNYFSFMAMQIINIHKKLNK